MTSNRMLGHKLNSTDSVSEENFRLVLLERAYLVMKSVLIISTTVKASRNTKPGYTITPKCTGRAEVLVMGGNWGGVENATGRALSRVTKAETRIL